MKLNIVTIIFFAPVVSVLLSVAAASGASLMAFVCWFYAIFYSYTCIYMIVVTNPQMTKEKK